MSPTRTVAVGNPRPRRSSETLIKSVYMNQLEVGAEQGGKLVYARATVLRLRTHRRPPFGSGPRVRHLAEVVHDRRLGSAVSDHDQGMIAQQGVSECAEPDP